MLTQQRESDSYQRNNGDGEMKADNKSTMINSIANGNEAGYVDLLQNIGTLLSQGRQQMATAVNTATMSLHPSLQPKVV